MTTTVVNWYQQSRYKFLEAPAEPLKFELVSHVSFKTCLTFHSEFMALREYEIGVKKAARVRAKTKEDKFLPSGE